MKRPVLLVSHEQGGARVGNLNTSSVLEIFLHGDLRAIKDGRLVHVVPRVQTVRRSLVIASQETRGPIVANLRIDTDQIRYSCNTPFPSANPIHYCSDCPHTLPKRPEIARRNDHFFVYI